MKCENCDKEHDGSYGSGRFCSVHCARIFSAKHVDYTKVSKTLRAKSHKDQIIETRICKWCNSKFNVISTSKLQCCCQGHTQRYNSSLKYQQMLNLTNDSRKRIQLELQLYRKKCQFSFSLDAYPEEFDFDLIKKYGWYKAKNRGDNPNGVSRDHMYSIKDGFLNNVDPKIMSHPANCRLVLQRENAKKRNKSCITLEQLKERIKMWNEKYKENTKNIKIWCESSSVVQS